MVWKLTAKIWWLAVILTFPAFGQSEYKGWLPYYPGMGGDTAIGVYIKNSGDGYAGFYAIRGTDTVRLHINTNGKAVLDRVDTLHLGTFKLYYLALTGDSLYINNDVIALTEGDNSTENEIQTLSYTASTRKLDLSLTETDPILPLFTTSDAGLVPAGGSGTSKYLRQDATWVTPPDENTTYTAGYRIDIDGVTINNTSYWGDQDTLKTTLSGLVKATSGKLSTVTDNSSNWNTAYLWGNHALAGYLTAEVDGSTSNELQNLTWDATNGHIELSDGDDADVGMFGTTDTTYGFVKGSDNVGTDYFLRADGIWSTLPSAGTNYWTLSNDSLFTNTGALIYLNKDVFSDRWIRDVSNTAFGYEAMGGDGLAHTSGTEGYYNTAIGNQSLYSITTGYQNTFLGHLTGYSNTSGIGNAGLGWRVLYKNTTGHYNTGFGNNALYENTIGKANIGLGTGALRLNTEGSNNVGIGPKAGYSNMTGNGNIFIGYQAGYNETGSYQLHIGYDYVKESLIRGDMDNDTLRINGALSIRDVTEGLEKYAVVMDSATHRLGIMKVEDISGEGSGIGDNLGNHQATQGLDMNGYDITEVDDILAQTLYATAGAGVGEAAISASSDGSVPTAIIERKTVTHYDVQYPLQLQAYGTTTNSDNQGVGIKYYGKDSGNTWELMGESNVIMPENQHGAEITNMVWKLNSSGSLYTEMTLTPDSLVVQGLRISGGAVRMPSLSSATSSNILYIQSDGLLTKGTAPTGSGSVTSVGLAAPTAEFDVNGSPVTSDGTLTLAWDNQTENKVLASPNGSTGKPAFRELVDADIPNDITASNYEPLLTKGTLSENVTGLEFTANRQVIGGNAQLNLTSGYVIPTTTQISSWEGHVSGDGDLSASNEIQNLTWDAANGHIEIDGGGIHADVGMFSTTDEKFGFVKGSNNKNNAYFLDATGSWSVPSSGGTVTTYDLSLGTGLTFKAGSGTDRILTGDATIGAASGYGIPTTTKMGQWDTAYLHYSTFDQDIDSMNEIQTLSYTASTRKLDLSITETDPILPIFSTDPGLVPASDGSSEKYLRGDGNWSTIATGGSYANGLGLSLASYTFALGNGTTALTDPGEDRILMWDDSETKIGWMSASTGLQISGTTLLTKDSEIDHDELRNFKAYNHFAQKDIDTVNTTKTGLLKAANGVLSTTADNTSNWDIAYTHSQVDGDVSDSNEGSLTVRAGTTSTSIISSNTSGSTDITLIEGTGIELEESGNTITITATGGGGGDGYWTLDGNDLYPNTVDYNVGIGTDSPTQKLTVTGSANVTSTLYVPTIHTGTIRESSGTGYLKMKEDGGVGITITTAAGYVGVHNDYPSQELDVTGDINVSDTAFIKALKVGAATAATEALDVTGDVKVSDSLFVTYIDAWEIDASSVYALAQVATTDLQLIYGSPTYHTIGYANEEYDSDLRVYNYYDDRSYLFIDDNGNVGLGNNTSPSSTLDVYGTFEVSGNSDLQGEVKTGGVADMDGGLTLDGGVADFNYSQNLSTYVASTSSNVTATDEHQVYIIDPDADINFTLASAVEEVGRQITLINNNTDDTDHTITILSGATTVTALSGMGAYEYKSVTVIYSGSAWFITAVWLQSE